MSKKYSEYRYTNMFLRMIDDSVGIDVVDNFVDRVYKREFIEMKSMEQANKIFGEEMEKFLSSLKYEELMEVLRYTGYEYKFINATLRGNWNYNEHGKVDDNIRNEFRKTALSIQDVINKFNCPDINFTCFRGTTLDTFSCYGVTNLSELNKLMGQYVYESGFTSTSILFESSYIYKNLDDGRKCNIGIKYLIPEESNDGALLASNNISYAANQNEFLLNSGALSKVVDISIDEINNTAMLTMVLIPKRVYELNYEKNNGIKR